MALTIQSKAFGMQKYAFSMRKHKENMLFKVFFCCQALFYRKVFVSLTTQTTIFINKENQVYGKQTITETFHHTHQRRVIR